MDDFWHNFDTIQALSCMKIFNFVALTIIKKIKKENELKTLKNKDDNIHKNQALKYGRTKEH